MGIHDRPYYPREEPSFLNQFGDRGRMCKILIAINGVCFLAQLVLVRPDLNFTSWFILDPERVAQGEVWRLLTYAFLHSIETPFHILFNMLFLAFFGFDLEDMLGPFETLTFYLTAAVLGGLAFLGWSYLRGQGNPCLGASGAVTAVMVLFALHYPNRPIHFMLLFAMPVWLMVAILVTMDALVLASGMKTTTAVTVHLAGAAFGFAYYRFQWRLLDLAWGLGERFRSRRRPRLRVYRGHDDADDRPAPPPPPLDIDEQLEAKLDAVLEKMNRLGRDSLTESERQILFRASEIYRRRRR
jgi:membrane associated rhomboid family serine protease